MLRKIIGHYSEYIEVPLDLNALAILIFSCKFYAVNYSLISSYLNSFSTNTSIKNDIKMAAAKFLGRSGPEVIKHISCSTQLSMKF